MSEIQKGVENINNIGNLNDIPQEIKDLDGFNEFINRFQDKKNDIIQLLSDKSKTNDIEGYIIITMKNNFPSDINQLEVFFNIFRVNIKLSDAERKIKILEQVEISFEEKKKEGQEKENEGREKEKNKKLQLITGFLTSIGELKTIDSKTKLFFQEVTKDFENSNKGIDEINQINLKITNYLKQGNNLQTILDSAKKSGGDNFDRIKKYVGSISSNDTELKAKFDDWLSKNQTVQSLVSPIREVEMREFFGKDYVKAEKTGDLLMLDDKILDTSTKPPTAYLKGKGRYILETDLPKIPNDYNEKRKKWHEKKQELIKDYKDKNTNLESLKQKLENKEKEYEEEKKDNGNDERLGKLEKEITEIKLSIEIVKKEILEITEKGNTLDTEMMQELSKVEFDDKNHREQKEEKTRQTLIFLHEIGFDLIPQNITDWLINQINSRPDRMGLFDSPIDLKNGELGNRSLGGGLSTESKVKFTDFLSKALGLEGNNSIDYYKIQRGYFGKDAEGQGVGHDGLKKLIDSKFIENGVFQRYKLLENLQKQVNS